MAPFVVVVACLASRNEAHCSSVHPLLTVGSRIYSSEMDRLPIGPISWRRHMVPVQLGFHQRCSRRTDASRHRIIRAGESQDVPLQCIVPSMETQYNQILMSIYLSMFQD